MIHIYEMEFKLYSCVIVLGARACKKPFREKKEAEEHSFNPPVKAKSLAKASQITKTWRARKKVANMKWCVIYVLGFNII